MSVRSSQHLLAALRRGRARGQKGFTLVELVMVAAVITIMAAIAIPAVRFAAKRTKEAELHAALRSMRYAIDDYKRYSDAGLIPVDLGTEGYPKDLDVLVEGIDLVGQIDKKAKFLRRIPTDPMTGKAEWGLRSFNDDPDSDSWGGENVYDVYSLSEGVGLNGVPYRDW
ncbi:MAG TPA: prepilin-type N-terminal cleavage/methylation domain-containing protein [Thermoanaerobaculia bacterium]|nr:prepilin-type N-terminal cleavage/methylation domain-containing protein [Thermoanaerobaculia bacterium]